MSVLVLPLRTRKLEAGRTKVASQLRVVVHPLLAPKRLLQLALIALVVVPIPSDDGPFKSHVVTVAQAKPTVSPPAAKISR